MKANINRIIIISVVIISLSNMLLAGNKIITILDPERQPIAGAVVSVISPQDSVIREAVISDQNGIVSLTDSIASDDFILTNVIGFEQYAKPFKECGDTIYLTQSVMDLNEVVVLGNKDQVRTEAGKIIFTPGNLKTQVSNGFDMFKYVPLVSYQNNKLDLLGKSVHILINGREPEVSQEQIKSQLMGTPSSWIKSIEVITTPGSSYDSSGAMGIINVNMIDRRKGAWTYFTLGGGVGDGDQSADGNIMLFFSHKRFKMQASGYGYWSENNLRSENINIYNPESKENSFSIFNKVNNHSIMALINAQLFISYDLAQNSRIGGGIVSMWQKRRKVYDAMTLTSKQDNDEPEKSLTQSILDEPIESPSLYYKIFYTLDTDRKGSNLEVSALYRHNHSSSYTKYTFIPENNETRNSKNRGGSANVNYTQVFNANQKMKVGYLYQLTHLSNFSNTPLQNIAFNYGEYLHATYLELTSIWNNTFSSTAGLRFEALNSKGDLMDGSSLYNRHDNDVFPTVNMTFSFKESLHALMLSIDRTSRRPQFHDLNPYVLWTTDNSCIVGNPELKTAKYWNFSAMYLFLQNYIFRVQYSTTKNSLSQWTFGKNGINYLTRINSPEESLEVLFQYNKDFFKLWRLGASAYFAYLHTPVTYEDIKVPDKGFSARLTLNNSLFFSNKYIPNIDINAQLIRYHNFSGLGSSWLCQLNCNLSKEVIKRLQVSLSLSASPLKRLSSKYEQTGFIQKSKNLNLPISGAITLSYYFGRTQIPKYIDGGDETYNSRFKQN